MKYKNFGPQAIVDLSSIYRRCSCDIQLGMTCSRGFQVKPGIWNCILELEVSAWSLDPGGQVEP